MKARAMRVLLRADVKARAMRVLLRLWRDVIPECVKPALVWALHPPRLVGVAALIQDDYGQVLVLRRSYVSTGRIGEWGLPGGFLGWGEAPEVGLARELREETGLDVEVGGLLAALADHRRPGRLDLLYRCRVVGGRPQSSPEVAGHRWTAVADAAALDAELYRFLAAGGVLGAACRT